MSSPQAQSSEQQLSGPTVDKPIDEEVVNWHWRSFVWFAVVASINHALNYVVNSYATSMLTSNLGGICLGACYTSTTHMDNFI